MTDKEKIQKLAQRVKFAVTYLKGEGEIYDMKEHKSLGHWTRVFAQDLRDCGFDCDDDAVDYAQTPRSQRKGKEWKALCAKLEAKGYKLK